MLSLISLFIARPAGTHNYHFVSLSVCGQLVKMLILLNHMVNPYQVLHTNACQHFLATGMNTSHFQVD